jgi:hypothetical protein
MTPRQSGGISRRRAASEQDSPTRSGQKMHPLLRVWCILQSNCAIDTIVWKRDMELVTKESEMSRSVSYMGRLLYGRQEANETLRWYMKIPKLYGCS